MYMRPRCSCFFILFFIRFSFCFSFFFFFQAEDGIRDVAVTGVQTCALPICGNMQILTATENRRKWATVDPEVKANIQKSLEEERLRHEIGRASCRERV